MKCQKRSFSYISEIVFDSDYIVFIRIGLAKFQPFVHLLNYNKLNFHLSWMFVISIMYWHIVNAVSVIIILSTCDDSFGIVSSIFVQSLHKQLRLRLKYKFYIILIS